MKDSERERGHRRSATALGSIAVLAVTAVVTLTTITQSPQRGLPGARTWCT